MDTIANRAVHRAVGVTDCQVLPWFFSGGDPDLGVQLDSLARFAETVMSKLEG